MSHRQADFATAFLRSPLPAGLIDVPYPKTPIDTAALLGEPLPDDPKGVTMRRRLLAGAATLALFAAAAAPASADRGPAGSTFPEQPTNVETACNAVLTNTGTGVANMSDGAFAITSGLIADACNLD
jgi:hypothetical protein